MNNNRCPKVHDLLPLQELPVPHRLAVEPTSLFFQQNTTVQEQKPAGGGNTRTLHKTGWLHEPCLPVCATQCEGTAWAVPRVTSTRMHLVGAEHS